ncbi:MAG: hypothetical protein JWO20_3108 [Candidatus Angelobacter sp.]|jgi:hypothetical protein|nr:hypothetical protein [Candidatus Angelobacter sp.]
MRILNKENARDLLKWGTLDSFIHRLSTQLPIVKGAFTRPNISGKQIVLSNFFKYLMLRDSPVYLYVTAWGIATEHLDLFYGYRRSMGEVRPLIEAPVHVFEPAEGDAFVSVLSMAFFFSWDAWVFDFTERTLLRISHDGWLEFRASDEELIKIFIAELERYGIPLLRS